MAEHLEFESHFFDGPGGRIHYLVRPNPGKPTLLALHGYKDTARTFCFIEPWLTANFELVTVDWPGHGESYYVTQGQYSGHRFLTDLIAFSGAVLPDTYNILAHSMGAALAARFAGIFPAEVQSMVLLEGFSGLIDPQKERDRIQGWARSLRQSWATTPPARDLKTHAIAAGFLNRLHRRLTPRRAADLAIHLTRESEGKLIWNHDPAVATRFFPLSLPPLVSRALWGAVECPVLLMYGADTNLRPEEGQHSQGLQLRGAEVSPQAGSASGDEVRGAALREITSHFKDLEFRELKDAGHNMHHDQPELVQTLIERFMTRVGVLTT